MTENTNVLDLDILVPEPKKVKFNGRVVTCNPPTLRHLISIARLEDEILHIKTPDEAMTKIVTVLKPIVPEMADEKFDITMGQLRVLLQYIKDIAKEVNESTKKTVKEVPTTTKKKVDSPKP